MIKIAACYKWVIDEADIKVAANGGVDFSIAKNKISEYDKNAIEAAVQFAKSAGGTSLGITFGGEQSKPSIKDSLSRGLDEVCWIKSEKAKEADGYLTAKAIAAAVNKIGDIKLIICAEGSSDNYARQTAPRIGAVLDIPVITSVYEAELNGDLLKAKRKLGDCIETVSVKLPAVISVLPDINDAPLPGLKAVLAAAKKPVKEFTEDELGIAELKPKSKVTNIKPYIMVRKKVMIKDGTPAEKAKQLIESLKKEGVL